MQIKTKNPLQLPNIYVICVCVSMYMHSVYKFPPSPESNPSFDIVSNKTFRV